MSDVEREKLWDEFLAAWPPERVRQMTLEEYTNPGKDDAFIYWLESPLEELGSIWGGSAFKFGIYHQANVKTKESSRGRIWGATYAWLAKYGATEQTAFATIRARLVEVLDAVQKGNVARIDEIDLPPMLKWKVAFLYQDRNAPAIFPIFAKDALFQYYRAIDPSAKLASTPYHVMYETLLERHRELGDVFAIADELWRRLEADREATPRAWAVPLTWTVDTVAVEALCAKESVEPEDIDSFLDNMLSAAELTTGDQLAILMDGDVRALGTLTSAEPGEYAWTQVPVSFPSGLLVNPTSEVRELDASERQEIWSHLPTLEPEATAVPGPRYWKIAPGTNAVAWPEWQKLGIIAIGWPKLGDLSKASYEEFQKRAKTCGYSSGVNQVWAFTGIKPGDRVLANQGKRAVLGVGTVIEGYRFKPGVHTVDGEDFPHQISVHWDDTTRRPVEESGWQRTLLELSKEDFDSLVVLGPSVTLVPAAPTVVEPPAPPCDPRNVILYGPPGTGKTYSTVRRALELILGRDKIAGLSERVLTSLFREQQARGQIEFVTFHQAYGYEEFVEGIRPVLDQGADAEVRYELHDGVFKRIALRAASEGLLVDNAPREFDELWELLVHDLKEEDGRVAKSQSGNSYQLELSSRGNILVRACEVDGDGVVTKTIGGHQTASKDNARLFWKYRAELGPEPEKLTYEKSTALFSREKGGGGGNHYAALWLVYAQLFALNGALSGRKMDPVDRMVRVQQALDKPGATTTFTFSTRLPQYVLIIDEINRGNMSKILGELITLLEPDKRLTGKSELKLPLSYSPHHRFAVPPNLHVLGTMNTADRSIALMDVALRRRFTFEELMPDSGVIRSALRDRVPSKPFIDLVVDIFETVNNRIRFLYDRDHQLGHSYFLDVVDAESLRAVFVDRIIPMLQEYFYGAWDKICTVLGCPYSSEGKPKRTQRHLLDADGTKAYAWPLVSASAFSEVKTFGFDHDDYEDRIDYVVSSKFQRGELSIEELHRSYLGVLGLDAGTHKTRLDDLLAVVETIA